MNDEIDMTSTDEVLFFQNDHEEDDYSGKTLEGDDDSGKPLEDDGLDNEEVFEDEEKRIKYTCEARIPYHYTSKNIRDKVSTKLTEKYGKNGTIVEKHVYNTAISLCRLKDIPLKVSDHGFQLSYTSIVYEVLSTQESLTELIRRLKSGLVEWKSPKYAELVEARETEEADHTQDVVEGIHECSDCKKAGRVFNKTRNIQIQTRGGDEGMTVFITCVICRKMWKQYN